MTPSRVAIALASAVGVGSLGVFAVFLFLGPLGLIDLGLSSAEVLVLDAVLCLAFCVQHSTMVRRAVRVRIEAFVPTHFYGVVYTFASSAMLFAMLLLWQESAVVVVEFDGGLRWFIRAIFLAALPGFVWSAWSIPRFDPLGVDPIKARLRGREPKAWSFAVRGPYRWVRHPQYFFTLVILWASPDLTADRLLLDGMFTVWIVLGTMLEERDLIEDFGEDYVEYRQHVPMLIPWRGSWTPG